MRSRTLTTSASAVLLLAASIVNAKHGVHEHLEHIHKRHRAHRELTRSTPEDGEQGIELRAVAPETPIPEAGLEKRGGQCAFPTGAGLVSVTPGAQNAGWAMSPNQPCTPGNYCPYACPPGQVSMQWDPTATSYSYPKSMNGGLYCDDNGNIQKPFPNKPYCQSTATNIGVQNNAGGTVAFCQTVLPGNEAMLIPTEVGSYANLAVPDTSYWCNTAAHYYINPPGIGAEEACVWGTSANPYGNWSPYVAGANTDASGNTFIKLGWNPIYLEPTTPFRNNMPSWGVEIDCPNGGCHGLPCAIDPSQNSVNEMVGSASNGAGGGAFCVVTVSEGSTANFVVFEGSAGSSSSSSRSGSSSSSSASSGSSSNSGSSSGSSSSSGSGASSGSWASSAKGGQFYQSSSALPSSTTTTITTTQAPMSTSTTTTPVGTSTWKAWSSSTTPLSSSSPSTTRASSTTIAWSSHGSSSHSSSSDNSSSDTSATSKISSSNWNSVPLPTHSPYYSLFNHTAPAAATGRGDNAAPEASAAASGTAIAPSVQPATGAASHSQVYMAATLAGTVFGILACL